MPLEPASGYTLQCPDSAAATTLRRWLDESRLAWPGPFHLDVTVSERCPFTPDPRSILRQPSVVIQAGPPHNTVRLEWDGAPAIAEVHPTRPEARLWLSPIAVPLLQGAERSFLLVLLVFLLRRLGWYHVHGAALIDPRGRGWMLAGPSHSGKSTTTALLASRGWRVSTDDIGFLVNRGGSAAILGMRSRIALRKDGLELLRARGGHALPSRGKEGFWPQDLGGDWTPEVVPRIIGFTQLGARTALTPLPPREVLSSLVKWSQWVLYEPVHAQEHLDALSRLAASAQSFDLTLGPDLFQRPSLLEELVP